MTLLNSLALRLITPGMRRCVRAALLLSHSAQRTDLLMLLHLLLLPIIRLLLWLCDGNSRRLVRRLALWRRGRRGVLLLLRDRRGTVICRRLLLLLLSRRSRSVAGHLLLLLCLAGVLARAAHGDIAVVVRMVRRGQRRAV